MIEVRKAVRQDLKDLNGEMEDLEFTANVLHFVSHELSIFKIRDQGSFIEVPAPLMMR